MSSHMWKSLVNLRVADLTLLHSSCLSPTVVGMNLLLKGLSEICCMIVFMEWIIDIVRCFLADDDRGGVGDSYYSLKCIPVQLFRY